MYQTVAVFGEAEKGQMHTPLLFHSLPELVDKLGNPPLESQGLLFGIQTLLYDRKLLFFRVEEEGFSINDYLTGLLFLQNKQRVDNLSAICLPGVGDEEIIEETKNICLLHNGLLITTEKDLYDYLTTSSR
jgi:hypothetical protein